MAHEALKKALEERKVALQARLSSIKTDVTQEHSVDAAEQAQERENDEVVDAIGNETRHSLHDIQVALDKIEQGTYGQCESCGQDIAAARLEALPEASHCVSCAD